MDAVNDYLNYVDFVETERNFRLEEMYLDEWENETENDYDSAPVQITDDVIDW